MVFSVYEPDVSLSTFYLGMMSARFSGNAATQFGAKIYIFGAILFGILAPKR
jgi:hypothetical protein